MEQRLFSVELLLEKIRGNGEPTKILFYETPYSNGAIWYVPPGKGIPAHYHPGTDDIWMVLAGEGEYYLGNGETHPIFPELIAIAPQGEVHGVRCTGNDPLIFVAISAPMPVETIPKENK